MLNSYGLETVEGWQMDGGFSSRRLRHYIPREGTPLAKAQAEFMEKVAALGGKRGEEEARAVAELRKAEIAEAERMRAEEIGSGMEETIAWVEVGWPSGTQATRTPP
ncbi:hypothetical protein B0H19DRAFT_1132032 [Mycena capillaripes]|nr:hypothetical protein B0H19DRAFT_1132032 [Mycena capillaripes]